MHGIVGIHHGSLTVTDLEVSARWYADVLGFVELFREDGDIRRAVVMEFSAGGYSVGLTEHRTDADTADAFDERRVGLDHLAFTVDTREHLDEWAERLSSLGVEHSGVIDVPSGAILNLRDPDGIALALFADGT